MEDKLIAEAAEIVKESITKGVHLKYGNKPASVEFVDAKVAELMRIARTQKTLTTVLKRVAIVLLMCSVGLGSFFAFNETARAYVIKWVKTFTNHKVTYTFQSEDTSTGTIPNCTVEGVVNGFSVSEEYEDTSIYYIHYENSDGNSISFGYSLISNTDYVDIVNDEVNHESLVINGKSCEYYPPSGEYKGDVLVWIDEKFSIVCTLVTDLGKEETVRLAKSISFY